MDPATDTATVCFLPTRNDPPDAWSAGLACRLPSGQRAYPSRLYWNQAPPRPYEIWLVRPCCDAPEYVKPLRRLAAAPFRNAGLGRVANHLLYRLTRVIAWPYRLGLALQQRAQSDEQSTVRTRTTHS